MPTAPPRATMLAASLALLGILGCGDPIAPPETGDIVEAGWSFGFCVGPCRATLAISNGRLSYEIFEGRDDETVFLSNEGSLTPLGGSRLAQLTADLPAELEPRYGCPDCADGGASWVERWTGGEPRRSLYEHFRPPPELVELDAFLREVIEALESCADTPDVTPASSCSPWERG